MNCMPLCHRKQSSLNSFQTIFMAKVVFPSMNEHILGPQLIKSSIKSKNMQQIKFQTKKLTKISKQQVPKIQSNILLKIYNLEDKQSQEKTQSDNNNNISKRFKITPIRNQDMVIKKSDNQIRIRSYSTEIQTYRTNNQIKSSNKKVRFYEKAECWIIGQRDDQFENYRYFEPINLK